MRQQHPLITNLLILFLMGIALFAFNPFIAREETLLLYDSKRFFAMAVIGLSLAAIALMPSVRQSIVASWQSLSLTTQSLVGVFLASSLIATLFALYPLGAVTHWLYLIGLTALLFTLQPIAYRERKRVWLYFCWISVLLFLSVALGFWMRLGQGLNVSQSTILSFVNPRFLNQVQIWLVIPIAYLVILQTRQGTSTLLTRSLLILHCAIIAATNARGPVLALLGASLLLIYADKPNRQLWWQLVWQSALTGFIVSKIFLYPLPSFLLGHTFEFAAEEIKESARLKMWQETLSMSNFWGLGGEAFVCDSNKFGRPHNSVLNVLVHWGVLAAISYVLLSCKALLVTLRATSTRIRVAGATLLAGLAYSLVSGVLDSPLSQLLAVLSCAIFWGALCPSQPSAGKKPRRLGFILIAVALLSLVSLTYKGYQRASHYPEYQPKIKTQFWLGYNCSADPGRK
ncbi:O-antigen ligase family protein [Vibrio sp. WXL210]|uniref:O-antigen ligase family protein n=1 Tax=Vibrio sp. WXL210 TaxID=3450709 RepID=UPI003EC73532